MASWWSLTFFLSGDPHFGSPLSKGRINVWKRFQIAFVTTIQIRVLWVSTTFPFSHQRLSKDLRKAKRRDAEALKSFVRKRWKRRSSAASQPQEFFHLQTDRTCPTVPDPTNCNRGMFQSPCQQNIFYRGSDLLSYSISHFGGFCFWLRSNIKMGLGKSNEKTSDKL